MYIIQLLHVISFLLLVNLLSHLQNYTYVYQIPQNRIVIVYSHVVLIFFLFIFIQLKR